MAGEADLAKLLRTMRPELFPNPYGIVHTDADRLVGEVFARIVEPEGVTVIAPVARLVDAGVTVESQWARISLTVHSDLAAVGLTAAVSAALASCNMSANVVAGYFHDHVFVQWIRRDEAMAILTALSAR